MTDTEVLDAIVKYQLWVRPSGIGGWTALGRGTSTAHIFYFNAATPQDAVREAIAYEDVAQP